MSFSENRSNFFLFYFSNFEFLTEFKSVREYRLVIHISIEKMVGVARFELAAPCSQNRCANRTALYPDNRTGIIQSYPIHRNWCFFKIFLSCLFRSTTTAFDGSSFIYFISANMPNTLLPLHQIPFLMHPLPTLG